MAYFLRFIQINIYNSTNVFKDQYSGMYIHLHKTDFLKKMAMCLQRKLEEGYIIFYKILHLQKFVTLIFHCYFFMAAEELPKQSDVHKH
jgi:hypothetical protein